MLGALGAIISELDYRTAKMTGFRLCDTLIPAKRAIPVYVGLTSLGNRKNFAVSFPKDLESTQAGSVLENALRIMLYNQFFHAHILL